ncbi:MAG: DUF1887 family protein [Lachnospiraceae bacterium]|nr:DUF1887 family protein [Lachnospiraceae bacterium]
MIAVYEFLGDEPIEDVITCLHFKVDKVVYFGYHSTIQKRKTVTEAFLKKYCGVQTVQFHELSRKDLQSTLKTMRAEIRHEKSLGGKTYFDITGGEDLILVAFGMLSQEFDTPMHLFDIPADRLIELDAGAKTNISRDVPAQRVELNLERLIELRGGVINWDLHKELKEDDPDFAEDAGKIWRIAKENWDFWNPLSGLLREHLLPDINLRVERSTPEVIRILRESKNRLDSPEQLGRLLDLLAAEGLVENVVHTQERFGFKYKSEAVKQCLWDGGSILELYTYVNEKDKYDDCKVGIHLDWDGVIHSQPGMDVLNEIDVLALKGNVPVFMSCKSGRMDGKKALSSLYELETVARRFGGKYAKKILISAQPIESVYLERATEMDIEVR